MAKMQYKSAVVRISLVASLGGLLEFFDFSLFLFLIDSISRNFFAESQGSGSFETLIIFSVGFVVRPLGGIFFGHLGDRWGRKKAFQYSLTLMSLSSFFIAVLPSFDRIGWWAPVLLLLARLVQGFSLGGEIPGAAIFSSEHFPEKRGMVNGLLFLGVTWGMLLTSLVILLVKLFLPESAFPHYGWRVCYVFGGLAGLLVLWLRSSFKEPQIFHDFIKKKRKFPLIDLFRNSKREIMHAFFAMALTSGNLFVMARIPEFINKYSSLHIENNSQVSVFLFGIYGLLIFLSGWISDRFGRKNVMLWGSVMALVGSFFFFMALPHFSSYLELYIWLAIWALALAPTNGTFACFAIERFPTSYRLSGFAFCYNLGFAFFAGIIPLVLTSLMNKLSGDYVLMGFVLILSVIVLVNTLLSKDYFEDDLKF
ncbi:MAG: MFS transporter [Bacteroidales bacterium]